MPAVRMGATLDTLAVIGLDLPAPALAKLRGAFPTVHYYPKIHTDPEATIPAEVRGDIDMVFSQWKALPVDCPLADLPKLKHIQLSTAGVDMALRSSPAIRELAQPNPPDVTLSTASGAHVLSIPNYVVAMTINLYHQIQQMLRVAREKQYWSKTEADLRGEPYYARSTFGRTVGLLGYGALGRETARLLKAHGMRVIAANTTGQSTSETEYVIPGTGDPDGSIPEKFFSTKDPASFEAFLRETDVLVSSLPSTQYTKWMLDAEKLALLKPDALFINVGRGDLIKSDEILKALDAGSLYGVALDVTEPEPLTDGHPLWTHPRVIVTPHLSGNVEGELSIGTDIAVENAERLRKGLKPFNVVDIQKGY
ncbi:uncharacterized protein EHS24_002267 [Apiotrichum porosum]|uniref:D-isomer specific 2-hydroxyacid dehydrogenase NAD-binding domain-containing protein n=1 Tax=Apiotrichum porosum TaxID=105984 RepID=A0A427XI30_9TREE|nr:uncharacterized protein EHS24_002267 [Apiotrichum porosum]RSH78541.1 hypothetical protein EHS24_002267 [Apiotrichum porosum]